MFGVRAVTEELVRVPIESTKNPAAKRFRLR